MPDTDPRSAVRDALLRRCQLSPEIRRGVDVLLAQADTAADPEARREILDTVAGMLTGSVGAPARRRGRPKRERPAEKPAAKTAEPAFPSAVE